MSVQRHAPNINKNIFYLQLMISSENNRSIMLDCILFTAQKKEILCIY
jgi:hypothetical protein